MLSGNLATRTYPTAQLHFLRGIVVSAPGSATKSPASFWKSRLDGALTEALNLTNEYGDKIPHPLVARLNVRRKSLMSLQSALEKLKVTDGLIEAHWANSPNGWIRALPNKKVGYVGERLIYRVLGGTHHTDNSTGYDIKSGEMKVEVKTSTLSFTRSNVWTWNQVRPNDPYTHLCFVAIYPDRVRAFNVPKKRIPNEVLWRQHGIGGDGGTTTQIKWNQRDTFPAWMTPHEIDAEPCAAPNGGPATQLDNLAVREGPPLVS